MKQVQPDTSSLRGVALVLLLAAIVLAGCGGGGDGGGYGNRDGDTTAASTTTPNPDEGAVFVSLAIVQRFGLVLADSRGRTLYGFDRDADGVPSCYGACAQAWPPLLGDEPHPSNGAVAVKLGTVERRDGDPQVTYAGHPLYTYGGDEGPGKTKGEGVSSFGGTWFVLKPSGQPAKPTGAG